MHPFREICNINIKLCILYKGRGSGENQAKRKNLGIKNSISKKLKKHFKETKKIIE